MSPMALLVGAAAAFVKGSPLRLFQEDGPSKRRSFVVSRGCPQRLVRGAPVRLFIAVPSAAANLQRRQWVRSTWCQTVGELHFLTRGSVSAASSFFVGLEESPMGRVSTKVEYELSVYGDMVIVPSWDGAGNVTAKQVHSMRYFALLHGAKTAFDLSPAPPGLAESRPTHYMRVEDDVYVNLQRITEELVSGVARVVPGPDLRLPTTFAWAFFVTEGAAHPYPTGAAFVLSANLVQALAAAHELAPLDIGRPQPDSSSDRRGKGGFHEFGWSTDDAFIGLLLRPFSYTRVNDRRFHDALGRGINAFPASNHSLAIHGLRTWTEFNLLHAARFDDFNCLAADPQDELELLPDGTSRLWMEVDGLQQAVFIRGCENIQYLTSEVCQAYSVDNRVCAALGAHFRAVCPAAAAHYRSTVGRRASGQTSAHRNTS